MITVEFDPFFGFWEFSYFQVTSQKFEVITYNFRVTIQRFEVITNNFFFFFYFFGALVIGFTINYKS